MSRPQWAGAALTVAVAALSFCCLYYLSMRLAAGPNAAILAAVLALSLARRRAGRPPRTRLAEFADTLLAGFGAGLVAWLLHERFVLGAVLFTVGLTLSVWLRRFGGNWRTLGGILALPFVAALVAPGAPHAAAGAAADILLLLLAALVTYAWDWLLRAWLDPKEQAPGESDTRSVREAAAGRLDAGTRMAVQMAAALIAAFLLGHGFFPQHWTWVVLSAFIVCSGALGRADALHKGFLRFGGALLGAVAAAALQYLLLPQGPLLAVLVFAALFVGLWLRERNYAWWAGSMTLVVALLYGAAPAAGFLGERLLAILLGALCGVAACWLVLPIRTHSVARRRLAEALLSLEELAGADGAVRQAKLQALQRSAAECERLLPPLRWHRRMMRAGDEHPAQWLELLQACADKPPAKADAELVKAVRLCRRALKEGQGLTTALQRVQAALKAG